MNRVLFPSLLASLLLGAASTSLFIAQQETVPSATPVTPNATTTSTYVLTGWSELGMHCMDGKDYSVFSVLPPYNTIHAQLWKRGEPPTPVTSGVTITYRAIADASGSINTSSAGKTNFWKFVQPLFLVKPAPEMGLAGYGTQSTTPKNLKYNSTLGFWEAVGIPTVPYDDAGKVNAYSMVRIAARDAAGNLLARADIVVPVSDEMSCKSCHGSGTSAAAKPRAGWVNNPDPLKDAKLNILRMHDDRFAIAQYLPQLKAAGWNYQSSLYATATGGTPVLCAACHADNALSLAGIKGVGSLSSDMHRLHGPQINPATSISLDQSAGDAGSCYLCHPGPSTQCKRGAMNAQQCRTCHGGVTKVGDVTRNPWLVEPSCQTCHHASLRLTSAFDANGKWIQPLDKRFATNDNVPIAGSNLYRFSKGHGGVYCAGCHNSTHAEFPSLQRNDNVYSIELQQHTGKITECRVCHTNVPVTQNKGPHAMHNIGQSWVNAHGDFAESSTTSCTYCHGSTLLGTYLSKTSAARTFNIENGSKSFAAGEQVSCTDCHSSPKGNAVKGQPHRVELKRTLEIALAPRPTSPSRRGGP